MTEYQRVRIVAGFYNPQTGFYTGADCTGSDGAANRVLTLSNASTSSQEIVTVDGTVLRKDTHYTVSHLAASSTVTFTVLIYDTQNIEVRYFI